MAMTVEIVYMPLFLTGSSPALGEDGGSFR